jgi:hypothetical protein
MSTVNYSETPFTATGETTTATPSTLTTFTVPDKTADGYDFEVFACRDNAAGPLVGYWKMAALARVSPSSGLASLSMVGGLANPATISDPFTDATLAVAFNTIGSPITGVGIIVQGLPTTSIWWYAKGIRKQFSSTP